MKIPTIRMQVPVFTEREYAPTPTSVNPEQEIGFYIDKKNIDIEYAAFLANLGEEYPLDNITTYTFPRSEYIDELFEAFVGTDLGYSLLTGLMAPVANDVYLFTEESAIKLMKGSLNRMLDNAIENDNTDVRDWI